METITINIDDYNKMNVEMVELKKQNEKLKKENVKLEAANVELGDENEKIEQENVKLKSNLIESFNFSSFVEGKSNHIALAAAKQIASGLKNSYNPLFIYGGVGLGKTHLMHAVGNQIKKDDPSKKIAYVHSEKFVSDMVKSLQLGAISEFKHHYRSLDALLIDDIQFVAKKEQSQEELFLIFSKL